jgi:hypothetical protein
MMDVEAKPELEVATRKPSDPQQPGWRITGHGSGMFTTLNAEKAGRLEIEPESPFGEWIVWAERQADRLGKRPNLASCSATGSAPALVL